MYTLILTLYIVIAVFILSLIMIQQNKGAEAGAFGGSGMSGTLFGSSGAGNFLSKLTTFCCIIFFLLSLLIANMNSNKESTNKVVDPFENIQLPGPGSNPADPNKDPAKPTLPNK